MEDPKKNSQEGIKVGVFRLNGNLKQYAIVPREKLRSQADLQALVEYWRLKVPSFIIETNCSSRDPLSETISEANACFVLGDVIPFPEHNIKFEEDIQMRGKHQQEPSRRGTNSGSTTENSADPQVRNDDAAEGPGGNEPPQDAANSDGQQAETAEATETTEGDQSLNLTRDEWKDFANKYLHQKVLKALSAVVSAADMTGGWILCRGSPTTNEKLLGEAMDSARAQPTVLVVDDLASYKDIKDLKDLETNAIDINKALVGETMEKDILSLKLQDGFDIRNRRGSQAEPLKEPDPKDNLWKRRPEEISAGWFANLLQKNKGDEVEGATGNDERKKVDKGQKGQKVDKDKGYWVAKFPWKRGTHFIFSDDFLEFDADLLGPSGYIAIHGSVPKRIGESDFSTSYLIHEAVAKTRPCILFDHTGQEAQMYARLIGAIVMRDDLDLKLKLLDKLEGKYRSTGIMAKLGGFLKKPFQQDTEEKDGAEDANHTPGTAKRGKSLKKPSRQDPDDMDRSPRVNEEDVLPKHVQEKMDDVQKKLDSFQKDINKDKPLCGKLSAWAWTCWAPTDADTEEQEDTEEREHYNLLKRRLKLNSTFLRDYANKGHKREHNDSLLSLAFVHDMIDLYCENPRLFRSVVVPVDPVHHSGDEIVTKVALSFARAMFEAKEVGAGDADALAVEQSWRFHRQLTLSLDLNNLLRSLFYFLYIVAALATVVVSSLDWDDNSQTDRKIRTDATNTTIITVDEDMSDSQIVTTLLATVASLCAAFVSLTSVDNHHQRITEAKAKVVKEIFDFRMRVGKYSLHAYEQHYETARNGRNGLLTALAMNKHARKVGAAEENHEPGSGVEISRNISKAMHDARLRFSSSIEQIVQDLKTVDLFSRNEEHSKRLRSYVQDELHVTRVNDKWNGASVSGPLSPDDYYRLRFKPLLAKVEREENSLRLKTRALQVLTGMLSGAAIILGGIDEIMYVPIVIAGSTALFQFLKVYDYERRFTIATAAARELRCLETKWEALSQLDRQLRPSIVGFVTTTEDVAHQFETSSAIQVDRDALGTNVPVIQQVSNYRGAHNV